MDENSRSASVRMSDRSRENTQSSSFNGSYDKLPEIDSESGLGLFAT